MKKFLLIMLSVILLSVSLAGCGNRKGEPTPTGFTDPNTGIEYYDVTPKGLFAVSAGEKYITVKNGETETDYYEVQFESPEKFLCYEDNGEFLLVRAKDVEEPTLATFNPVAAFIYDDSNKVFITNFFADNEYLPDELKEHNPTEDTWLCKMIVEYLVNGEEANISDSEVLRDDMFYIRLLSQKYPGLYYNVVFFGTANGRYFLADRATGKIVYAPNDIIVRMVGG